jgi:ribosome biogenesis GTPase
LSSERIIRGLVTAAYGRRFLVECADGITRDCVTRGKRNDFACGDDVSVAVQNDTQGAINDCAPRKSLLYRSDQWKQKLIAANVTQVVVVVAPVPSFDLNVLDCCLAAAGHANIDVLIVLNKAELPEAAISEGVLAPFAALGYPLLKLVARDNIDPLRPLLDGKRSVLVGESGMGKSTILNQLLPEAVAQTREVSASLGTGKHTTTHARGVDQFAARIQVIEAGVGGGVFAGAQRGRDFARLRDGFGQQLVEDGRFAHARLADQHAAFAVE